MISLILLALLLVMNMWQSNGYEKVHQYNPNGRIFQLERAKKASQKGNPVIGIKCNDGVIIVLSKKKSLSRLIEKTPIKHFLLDKNIQFVVSGLSSDGKAVADVAKSICDNYKNTYMTSIPLENLCEELSAILHRQTFSVVTRPVGLRGIIVGWDAELGFQIYTLEPDGNYAAYKCVSVGGHEKLEMNLMNDFEQDDNLKNCLDRSIMQVYPSLLNILKRRFRKDNDSASIFSSPNKLSTPESLLSISSVGKKMVEMSRSTSSSSTSQSHGNVKNQKDNDDSDERDDNEDAVLDIDVIYGCFPAKKNDDIQSDDDDNERKGNRSNLIWSSLQSLALS